MKSVQFCLLLLLSVHLVREGYGVITGPRSRRELGQVEPRTIEVEEGEELSELLEKEAETERRLHKRQSPSTTSGIGTTAHLTGDGHNQAVVHWTGYPSERIFIVTRARTGNARGKQAHSRESWLWRSTDYGQTFVNETNKLDSDAVIEWYYISPRQNNLIFADRGNRRLYVTRDEGDTYTRYDIPFTPDNLRFQSVYAPHSNDSDLSQHVLGYDATNQTLWVSSDLGANWTLLAMNVTDGRYYWRVMNASFENLTAVYFETIINSTHAELHNSVHPYTAHDVFDPSLGPFLNHSFVLTHEYMLVQKSTSVGHGYQSPLWVSYYRKPFRQARFPLQTVERHYSVVDASEGQVFIAVYHSFNNTNLYLSEEQGLNYSLSLEYIISPPESSWDNPTFDVHVVEGIVGTYIANRKTPGSRYGATVISFDKGGTWNLLTPPASAVTTSGTVCVPPVCSLHLHMDSDRVNGYQSILSQDSAVGLIMALGNLGSALQRSYSSRSVQLYFSRDGGFTWQEVSQGFWEFQFAALGSIIVTVPKWTRTTYVKWSCDEGASWNTTSFVNTRILVVGMLTERGEKARHVTVFGSTTFSSSGFYWMVIDLNFTDVVPDECSSPDDYFQWIPTDERPGSRCLLGEAITYERRQSGACCYVDPEYDKPISRTPCVCAIEDFECDFGFERVNLNSPCTPLPYLSWPPPPPTNCPEQGNYSYTSGYRKVAGDRCVPGDEAYFLPITRPCPIRAPQGLFISHPPVITPGDSVTFNLTQLLGGRLSTHYIWYFGDGSKTVDVTGYDNGRSQVHTFQRPGTYTVNVTATNIGGTSQGFSVVSVLYKFNSLVVESRPTVRTSAITTVNITVYIEGHQLYTGPLILSAQYQNGTQLVSGQWPNSKGKQQLQFVLSDPGMSTLSFTAGNDIMNLVNTSRVLAVAPSQYGDIRLTFVASSRPRNTTQLGDKLVNSVINYVSQRYTLSPLLIEVERPLFYTNDSLTTRAPSPPNILKRSGEQLVDLVLYILPANLSNIDATIELSKRIMNETLRHQFVVDNQSLVVARTYLRSQPVIIIDTLPQPPNTKLYLGLGVGLGLLLIVVVTFSVLMIVATYYYRRKYSRLHVRYSRLQQGPVRFTFTAQGEMVEEEEVADNISDDDPTYGDDQKVEIVKPLPRAVVS